MANEKDLNPAPAGSHPGHTQADVAPIPGGVERRGRRLDDPPGVKVKAVKTFTTTEKVKVFRLDGKTEFVTQINENDILELNEPWLKFHTDNGQVIPAPELTEEEAAEAKRKAKADSKK